MIEIIDKICNDSDTYRKVAHNDITHKNLQ